MAHAPPRSMADPGRFAAQRDGDPRMASDLPAAVPVPAEIARARTLTRVLDHYLVDPLLGLVLPGAGDLIGSLLGLYVVGIAVRRRTSPVVIARMLLNLALDAGLGLVPIVGDLADFAFKANQKNLALLSERFAGGTATPPDRLF